MPDTENHVVALACVLRQDLGHGEVKGDYSRTWDVRGEATSSRRCLRETGVAGRELSRGFMGRKGLAARLAGGEKCRLCLPSCLLRLHPESGNTEWVGVEASQSRPPAPSLVH